MPSFIVTYVRVVDSLSTRFGRIAMYLIFVMIATLLTDAITRNILQIPMFWCVEMAQFTLAAYYKFSSQARSIHKPLFVSKAFPCTAPRGTADFSTDAIYP